MSTVSLDASRACTDCMMVTRLVVLGDTSGPGLLLDEALDVLRDSAGRYWVSQRGAPKVFSASGVFLRQVGRPGEGPMEFVYPRLIHVDGQGRVHIFDRNQRETIVDSAFNLAETAQMPALFEHAVPVDSGHMYVANLWLPTAEAIGLPLHLVSAGKIARSFGVVPGRDTTALTHLSAQRVLAVDRSGRVLAVKPYQYRIEAWSIDGRRVGGLAGPQLNPVDMPVGDFSPDVPPPNRIFAARVDSHGRLWLATWQRKEQWLEALEERVQRDGSVGWFPKDGTMSYASIYRGRVDVIDLDTQRIIARRDGAELFMGFVGDDLLEVQYDPDGSPRPAVWQVELNLRK